MKTEKKLWRRLFIIVTSIHVLSGLGLGLFTLINFPFALETGFGIPHSPELDILGIVISLLLIFLGSISLLSILWTVKGNKAGIITGIGVGIYMFTFGIVAFLKLGQTDGLLVDSLRGLLSIVFGYMAYRELQQSTSAQ